MSASHIPAAPRRRGPFISTLSAAAAALALSLGAPTSAGAQTVFHACYVPASGTVYRIKAVNTPAACLQPTHVAFSWTDGAEAAAALQDAVKNTDQAAGDVTGVFSNLTVGKLLGRALATTPPTNGQVLTWNAGTQQWEAKTVAAGGAGGATDHGALTGLGDDDHVAYLRQGTVRTGDGFAIIASPIGSWTPPLVSTGLNYAFAVMPARGAVRVGQTNAETEWTEENIGLGSASFGTGNLASGATSFAAGRNVRAEGSSAIAVGASAKATGNFSFAAGHAAEANGQASVAIGLDARAAGFGAVAIGAEAKSTGQHTFAFSGEASGIGSFAFGKRAHTNSKNNAIVFAAGDPADGLIRAAGQRQFVVSAQSIFLGNNNTPTMTAGRFIETGTGAYLSNGGVWSNVSDSTRKANFRAVDGESVLSRLSALPVYTWNYTEEDTTTRHMGPTAQAFRAAFGLGDTDRAISTVDIDGVAIAGVKALEVRTKQLKAETQALRAENAMLTERLAQLEALVERLTQAHKER